MAASAISDAFQLLFDLPPKKAKKVDAQDLQSAGEEQFYTSRIKLDRFCSPERKLLAHSLSSLNRWQDGQSRGDLPPVQRLHS